MTIKTRTKSGIRKASESALNMWWRRAVLAHWRGRCAICGSTYELECHHVIKRRKKVLRWDWRNGVALCTGCHRMLHDYPWKFEAKLRLDYEYLERWSNVTIKEHLLNIGMSEAEWTQKMLTELKEKASGSL